MAVANLAAPVANFNLFAQMRRGVAERELGNYSRALCGKVSECVVMALPSWNIARILYLNQIDIYSVPPSDLLLRLGEYDLAEEEEPYGYQERRVYIVVSHPQFDARTFEYDLALLRFFEPVEFQPNIIPVCVPDNDETFIGRTAFVTGWGRLYEGI